MDDKDFHIIKDALSELRGYVTRKRLHDTCAWTPNKVSMRLGT